MTPKEKAKELYLKYEFVYIANYTSKHEVKQCALITVDEIIEAHPIIPLTYMLESEAIDAAIEYWNEVKSEIKKL